MPQALPQLLPEAVQRCQLPLLEPSLFSSVSRVHNCVPPNYRCADSFSPLVPCNQLVCLPPSRVDRTETGPPSSLASASLLRCRANNLPGALEPYVRRSSRYDSNFVAIRVCSTAVDPQRNSTVLMSVPPVQPSSCSVYEAVKCEYCRESIPAYDIANHRAACAASQARRSARTETLPSNRLPVSYSPASLYVDSSASSRRLRFCPASRLTGFPRGQRRSYTQPSSMGSFLSSLGPPASEENFSEQNRFSSQTAGTDETRITVCDYCGASLSAEEQEDHALAHRLQDEEHLTSDDDTALHDALAHLPAALRSEQLRAFGDSHTSLLDFALSESHGLPTELTRRLVAAAGSSSPDSRLISLMARFIIYNGYNRGSSYIVHDSESGVSRAFGRPTSSSNSRRDFSALPIFVYSDIIGSRSNSLEANAAAPADQTCVICLEEYNPDDRLRRLPCLHFFHVDCIDRWLQRSPVCPSCKTEL